jgi:hypothetical protein
VSDLRNSEVVRRWTDGYDPHQGNGGGAGEGGICSYLDVATSRHYVHEVLLRQKLCLVAHRKCGKKIMADKGVVTTKEVSTVEASAIVRAEYSFNRGELLLTREMGEKEAEVRLQRINADLRIAEIQKESAAIQAEAMRDAVKVKTESQQKTVSIQTEAQKKIAAIPARHTTIRHIITASVVGIGMYLVYAKPEIGLPMVGLVTVLAGANAVSDLIKKLKPGAQR